MTRNCIWMGVFSQVVTMPLLRAVSWSFGTASPHRHAGRTALVSASGQCHWPVVAWPRCRNADCQGLTRLCGVRFDGQDLAELAARADGKLGEYLAQVVLDRARADEQ